jgi:cathepsin L
MKATEEKSEKAPQENAPVSKTCSDETTSVGFTNYMRSHNRTYALRSTEFLERKSLFMERMQEAQHHNCKHGKRLWTAGPTSISDRTESELATLMGYKPSWNTKGQSIAGGPEAQVRFHALVSDRPQLQSWPKQNFTWTHLKAAREVIDQGSCGSCWAAGTVAVLRAHANIYSEYREFSLQQLVSCVPNPESCGGEGGCSGSTGELALDYVMHNGLELESSFPYKARDVPCPK